MAEGRATYQQRQSGALERVITGVLSLRKRDWKGSPRPQERLPKRVRVIGNSEFRIPNSEFTGRDGP